MFGRKRSIEDGDRQPAADDAAPEVVREGPFDVSEVDLSAPSGPRVDLGSLLVTGGEGLELRLQADQQTSAVTGVMLAGAGGALELRAFAAPKSGGLWAELLDEIVTEAERLGGAARRDDGPFGPELRLQVPVTAADGRSGVQVSRVVGVEGPRWLLRATFLGAAAGTGTPAAQLEQALRQLIVVRGPEPMSPRQPLPLRLPPGATAAPGAAPASGQESGPQSGPSSGPAGAAPTKDSDEI
jgi:hypothetical protein